MDDKKDEKGVFDLIEGLKSVDPQELEEFKHAMAEDVIPEIVKIVEERRLLAASSRNWQLEC